LNLADAVAELNPADDLRQAVLAVEFAPFLLRRHHQLERHGQAALAAEVAVSGPMVRAILAAIHRLRAPPSCA